MKTEISVDLCSSAVFSRRDALAILIATSILPKLTFSQEATNAQELFELDPAARTEFIKDFLKFKLENMPGPHDELIGTLIEIAEAAKSASDSFESQLAAERAIESIVNSNSYKEPDAFRGILKLIDTDDSETYVDSKVIDWGSAIYDLGVAGATYAGKLTRRAALALDAIGILAPPTAGVLNEKTGTEFPPVPTKAQFQAVENAVIDRALDYARKDDIFDKAVNSKAFKDKFGLSFNPSTEELKKGSRSSSKKLLKELPLNKGNRQEVNDKAVEALKSGLRERKERLEKLTAELEKTAREQKEREKRQKLIEEINYNTREVEGYTQLAGFLAKDIFNAPEAAKILVASGSAIAKVYQLGSLHALGQIGTLGFLGGIAGVVGSFFGLLKPSNDELILQTLAIMDKKLDRLLEASYRIERRQILMLEALKKVLTQMSEFRGEVTQSFNEVKEHLKQISIDLNQNAREEDEVAYKNQMMEARSLIRFHEKSRTETWRNDLRKNLLYFAGLAVNVSCKSAFTGNSTEIKGFKELAFQEIGRSRLDLMIGLLPAIVKLALPTINGAALHSYLGSGTQSVPNPVLWALGTESYLMLRIETENENVRDDQENLTAMWRKGVHLRKAILELTTPEAVKAASLQFLNAIGVTTHHEPPTEAASIPEIKEATDEASDIKIDTLSAQIVNVNGIQRFYEEFKEHETWKKSPTLMGVIYRAMYEQEAKYEKFLPDYEWTNDHDWGTVVEGNPGFFSTGSITSGVRFGKLYYSNIEGRRRPNDVMPVSETWIKNDPIDRALEIGAVVKSDVEENPNGRSRFKLKIKFGPNAGKYVWDGKVIDQHYIPEFEITDAKDGQKKKVMHQSRTVENGKDVTPLLGECEKLVHEYIAWSYQESFARDTEAKLAEADFKDFEGAAVMMKIFSELSKAKYADILETTPKLSDTDGVNTKDSVNRFISNRVKQYPNVYRNMSLRIISDLSAEFLNHCSSILNLAVEAPTGRSLPILDMTLYRLATYMELKKIPIPVGN